MDKHKSIVVVGLIVINSCSFALIAVLLMLWIQKGRSDAIEKEIRQLIRLSFARVPVHERNFIRLWNNLAREKKKQSKLPINWVIERFQSEKKRRWKIAMNVNTAEEISSSGSFTMLVSLARRMSTRLTRNGQSLKTSWGGFEGAFDYIPFDNRMITLKRLPRASIIGDVNGDTQTA